MQVNVPIVNHNNPNKSKVFDIMNTILGNPTNMEKDRSILITLLITATRHSQERGNEDELLVIDAEEGCNQSSKLLTRTTFEL